ncbi:MAG TPA: aminotransferase class V-fold PLP-dependent enzyme [Thermoleophilaceae bacterium]|nr:aminotransferase class V-fold PLP-dependent enzyme [Thermoleophilaceae bacterium]
MSERERAEQLDAEDPLAGFRERFVIEDEETIYLDGNSLGRLPLATRERTNALLDQWGRDLVSAWDEWIELPERVGDLLGAAVLDARPGETIVSDSTTVNLFKLAGALLAERPGKIVGYEGDFPTNRYVLGGLGELYGRPLQLTREGLSAVLTSGEEIALVCLSHVDYRTGELLDTEKVEELSPAPVIWDLSHSAGVARPKGIGFAVGATYKYLNGGPGAPAFLYVREDSLWPLKSPIQGWFGQQDQFVMADDYEPAGEVRRFLTGTPNIPALVAIEEGVRIVAEAGVDRLRAKAEALTSYAVELHDTWLAPLGFELWSPRDPIRRGAHVSVRHERAWPICRALIQRAKVIPDFREPDVIRLGLAPLYTRFVDVHEALDRLRGLVERGDYDASIARARVT